MSYTRREMHQSTLSWYRNFEDYEMDLDLHSVKNDLGNGRMLSVSHVLDRTSSSVYLSCEKMTDRHLTCRSISENTIRDVSGAGIAVRGAPGTQVHQNTIVARDRDMLAGIAIVANPIFVKPGVEIDGVAVRYVHLSRALVYFG